MKYDHFVHFKCLVENQFNATINQFQCDGRGEFLNKKLEHLFNASSIVAQFSCPRSPQQNDKVERMHHTLLNSV